MLKDNIRSLRKEKGLSQEELAVKLNVVRQTVSKWEQGLSVPDAELLVSLAEAFDVPVSTLLGESISEEEEHDHLKEIAEKLEVVNAQLARNSENRRKTWHIIFMAFCIVILAVFLVLASLGNSYMEWNYSDPELAVLGTGIHAFIWVFVRIAPFALLGSIIGVFMTRKRQ
ncbi:MAG: helix-turn-helix transcriptional regulator [Erysipelotrichaceae bacterium]|nr:helix-turn-helix transcriptional regulator [Erysipelotrichaceae bacterium]